MRRCEAIESIMARLDGELVVCTLGRPSQELFALRDRPENFYMLGSMGLASSIGLGLALTSPARTVVVLDGDGSVLMNLGTLASIAVHRPQRYILIIIDNGSYGSTGCQETYTAKGLELAALARSCGIPRVGIVTEQEGLNEAVSAALTSDIWPVCIVAKVAREKRGKLPVVPLSPVAIQRRFRKAIHGNVSRNDRDQESL
jgi:sulfopyruvate decarboxylase subunit beta